MLKGTESLASLAYTRDNDGQLKGTTSKGLPGEEKPAYEYDKNSRLTKGAGVAYEYDAANNPTKLGANTYKYSNADELETGTGYTYTYNEDGQRTKTTPSTGSATTYGYDQAGNLTSAERPKQGETPEIKDTYAYNGENLRTSQTISGTTSYLAWDMAEELPQLLSDGTNNYIEGPAGPIEQISTAGTTTYLHHDQQGSTRLLTGSTGTVTGSTTFDAYGNKTGSTGTSTTPLGYVGQYTNADTGLIYLRARTYDPATGQFLTVDPLVGLTRAPYNYAGDNPTTYADPTGLSCSLNPTASGSCFAQGPVAVVGEAVASETELAVKHPVEAGGIVLGGVAAATGVGEVVVGGTVVAEGTLGVISGVSGFGGAVLDTKGCIDGSGVSCVGASVGAVATGGTSAVALGAVTGVAASGTTAISVTSGAIGFMGDVAGAFASPNATNNPLVSSGCGFLW